MRCAKAQQELSKSECQTGCVTSWSLLWYREVHSGFDAGMRPVVSYVGRKKHSCSVAKQAIDGGNAAVAQKNVVQAEAIITPASTMNTFWLHTWLHVLCIRVTHVNYTHIFFPSVEIAKPWYWRPVDWQTWHDPLDSQVCGHRKPKITAELLTSRLTLGEFPSLLLLLVNPFPAVVSSCQETPEGAGGIEVAFSNECYCLLTINFTLGGSAGLSRMA